MSRRKIGLAGKRFGRITVIEECGRSKQGAVMWLCMCDCGAIKKALGANLSRGFTQSCGCYCPLKIRKGKTPRIKKGFKYSKFYNEWADLCKMGYSVYDISKKYNCNFCTVKKGIEKTGTIIPPKAKKTPLERYNNFVVKKEDGCWGWSGSLNTGGYGALWVNDRLVLAHRFSYLIHKGNPDGNLVLHSCDNPVCTNPDHLFLGGYLENALDCIKKGRHAKAWISVSTVLKIKKLILQGKRNKDIGAIYGISPAVISLIKTGRTWKHIKQSNA